MKNSPLLRQKLEDKAKIISAIREFFDQEGFLEIDTPNLVQYPDPNPFNEVFEIKTSLGERLFLTPSPEFNLKKILSLGIKNIYQIGKAYRDRQENDPLHLKEFMILEWYRNKANYFDLMSDCENLIAFICRKMKKNPNKLIFQGNQINLSFPWKKISCKEAFEKYAGIILDEFIDINSARQICREKGYAINPKNTWEEMYHQIFLNEVEPKIKKEPAVILFDYPAPLAALSIIKKDNPNYAERFEFYLGGLEIGNGYSELTDWQEQEKRLKDDIKKRKEKKMKLFDCDQELVEALKRGLPPTAGIAVGIDRLIMLFTDSADIRRVSPLHL